MIPVFSPNGMEHSLVVPIFIGMLVTHQLVERYGLVFSGLVVPGYLAPILISQPESAAAILVESMLTYLVARGLHALSHRTRWLVPLFGRERFFLIIVAALAVRLSLEAFVFPALIERSAGPLVAAAFSGRFGAIGLIVIPLLANLFWKPGLGRGLAQVGLSTAAVALILTFLVYPLTNFDLSRLDIVFEDVALDLAASARAQVFLLTGALVASRFNRTQGWDFGGILVPALLSVALLEPVRLGATLLEAVAAVLIGRFLTKLPPLNRITLTGGRVVVFLFSVVLLLKLAMGWVLHWFDPSLLATDLSGFGYVISALIASKLWTKGPRTTLFPLVGVSAITFCVATAVSATLATGSVLLQATPEPLPTRPNQRHSLVALTLLTARTDLSPPSRAEFLDLRQPLLQALELSPLQSSARLIRAARERGVEVRRLDLPEPYVWLRRSGGAAALIRLQGRSNLVLSVVGGGDAWGASLVGAELAQRLQPGVVVGAPPQDSLRLSRSEPLALVLDRRPERFVLEVVGSADPEAARLDVFGELHDGLQILRARLPRLELAAPGVASDERALRMARAAQRGFARLTIGQQAVEELLGGPLPLQRAWLHERLARPATSPSPPLEELLALQRDLVRRFLRSGTSRPRALERHAAALGLQLERIREPEPGGESEFFLLGDPARARGALLLGPPGSEHVEIPQPKLYPGTLQAGLQLFLARGAHSLACAGEVPGSFELVSLAQQVFARAQQGAPRALQVRGARATLGREALFAPPQPLTPSRAIDEVALRDWLGAAKKAGWNTRIVSDARSGGFDLSGSSAARLRRKSGQVGVAGVWLGPEQRRSLSVSTVTRARNMAGVAGLPVDTDPLAKSLKDLSPPGGAKPRALSELFAAWREGSPAALLTELQALPLGWSGVVLLDESYRVPLLLLRGPDEAWALLNPNGRGEFLELARFLSLRGGICWGAGS